MNKSYTASITWLIILGIVILVFGFGIGILYQSRMGVSNPDKATKVFNVITSKAIPSILVYGQVTNIQGKDVTLTFAGDSVTVTIDAGATIYSFTPQNGSQNAGRQQLSFNDIKKGQTLNVSVKVLPSGLFQGSSVIIFPN